MNYVISITGPEALGVLEDICVELALPLNVTLHGRGTAVQSMLDLLGIESNEKRVVLSTATEEKTAALIEAQKRRLHIGVPGHGIVIAVSACAGCCSCATRSYSRSRRLRIRTFSPSRSTPAA